MIKQAGFLRKVYDFFRISSLQSQEEYFKFQLLLIELAKEKILIYGYDDLFMDRVETVKAFEDVSRKINISAVVPKSHGHIPLERIAENTSNIEILRTDEELRRGYMVCGEVGVSYWNSTRETSYAPEIGKGVIHRVAFANHSFGAFMNERLFDKKFAQLKDKALI